MIKLCVNFLTNFIMPILSKIEITSDFNGPEKKNSETFKTLRNYSYGQCQ